MIAAVDKVKKILESQFEIKSYVELVKEVFASVKIISPDNFRKEFSNFSSHIKSSSHVGSYEDRDGKRLAIFAVELKKDAYVERSRSTQRSFAKKLIENGSCDAAFIAFFTEGDSKWRLSFVRLDYEIKVENGKLQTAENITPAKRYSYLVGEKEPSYTAIDRFRRFIIDNGSHPKLDEIEDAFSVEKVTKEFFDLYLEKFLELKEHLDGNGDFVMEANQHNFTSAQFAKKLMGQVVFLYFLQKKGWLGVGAWPTQLNEKEYKNAYFAKGAKSRELIPIVYNRVADDIYKISAKGLESISDTDEEVLASCVKGKPWGSGPHDFMRRLFTQCVKKDGSFFEDYLEPLFYDALNVNRGESGYCPTLHCRIPFLSGGLFEPIDGYEWKYNTFDIPNSIFSNKKDANDVNGTGILDIFDRYNFTISEDEPLEKEVAIDPEMLGKIFENLLEIKDRKSKGAFYTPREIVHYMCQESLINYITNKIGIDQGDIREFILYGDFMKDEDTVKEKRAGNGGMYIPESIFKVDADGIIQINRLADIDSALETVKVADPAVGSGAFPLGMLNEIVRARENISAYMGIGKNAAEIRMMYSFERHPYNLKLNAIQNSIFAVDIEPSAVDIAQLRLWLALVIDDEINPEATSPLDGHKNPIPLPNLECNILCGNSLMEEFEGTQLINSNELLGTRNKDGQHNIFQPGFDSILPKLIDAQNRLFRCADTNKKAEIKLEIESIRDIIIHTQLAGVADKDTLMKYEETKKMASKPFILWQLDFAKVFIDNGGFDIVIGNPPYIGFHNVPDKEYYKEKYIVANGKYDFYILFIEKGLNLLKQNGFESFICPSYFYKRNYGKNVRELLLKNTDVRYIADFKDYQIFDSALTYTCIFGIQKGPVINDEIKILGESLNEDGSYSVLQSSLSEPSWNLEKEDRNIVLNKIKSLSDIKFADITKSISQGIVTGFNDIYLITDEIINEYQLEKLYLEPAYKGKDIKNGRLLETGTCVFYPYIINDCGKTVAITEECFRETAPNLYTYLSEKKAELLCRDYFNKSSKQWFELWNCRRKEHFFSKKFVFAEISLFNDFVLVDKCFYTDSACGAELKPEYEQYYNYLLLYLNSDVITYLYKKISVPKANGYSIYKNAFLKELPIAFLADPNELQQFEEMTQEDFNDFIREKLGISRADNTIKQTLENYR